MHTGAPRPSRSRRGGAPHGCTIAVCGGPDQELPRDRRYAAVCEWLAARPATTAIVRRYREDPAPMVRDLASGWRTGRLDTLLSGDFDLIGAVPRDQAAE